MQAHAGHAWEHSGSCSQAAGARVGVGACAEGCTRAPTRLHSRPSATVLTSARLRLASRRMRHVARKSALSTCRGARRAHVSRGREHHVSEAATRRPQRGSVPAGGTCRPRPHGCRCARTICNLALSGASEHAPEASHVSISNPRRDPGWRCHRGSSATRRGQAPTRSRPWRPRAILADPNGLWW